MTLKDYQSNQSKILEFLHGLKYAGQEFVHLLQVLVSKRIFLVFNCIFFPFSDFKFSTQFVSTLIVAGIILFEVSFPHIIDKFFCSGAVCDPILILVYVVGLLLSNLKK